MDLKKIKKGQKNFQRPYQRPHLHFKEMFLPYLDRFDIKIQAQKTDIRPDIPKFDFLRFRG